MEIILEWYQTTLPCSSEEDRRCHIITIHAAKVMIWMRSVVQDTNDTLDMQAFVSYKACTKDYIGPSRGENNNT